MAHNEVFFQGYRGPEAGEELIRYGVIGSANLDDYELLREKLDGYGVTNVTTGDAIGAQSLAVRYANERGYGLNVIWTDIERYGAGARFMRNHLIAEWSDIIIIFWDGESRGTRQTIRMAKEMGIPARMVLFRPKGKTSKRAEEATQIFSVPEEFTKEKSGHYEQRDLRP